MPNNEIYLRVGERRNLLAKESQRYLQSRASSTYRYKQTSSASYSIIVLRPYLLMHTFVSLREVSNSWQLDVISA